MGKAILWGVLLTGVVGIGFCALKVRDGKRFQDAVAAGDEARVRVLLEKRPGLAHLSTSDSRSRTTNYRPLHAAAEGGHTRIVSLLLDHGADVNATILGSGYPLLGGKTALHEGIGHPEIVSLLLARGANVDARDGDGKTALHGVGDGATTRQLLERGAKVNAADREGRTPLHDQAFKFTPDSAAELCAHGADPTAKNSGGLTPAELAAKSGDPVRAAWLGSTGGCGRISSRYRREGSVPPEMVKAALYELRCVVLPEQMRTHRYSFDQAQMAWSCAELGRLSELGEGVEKDLPRAMDLYRLACQGGSTHACDRLRVLASHIEKSGTMRRVAPEREY